MATSRGFNEFGRRMTIVADGIGNQLQKVVRKAALVADQVAVLATPVDTGRARANWIASIGASSDDTVPPNESGGRKSEARGAANAQPALDQAQGVIAGYRLGQTIFLTNNVEYISFLDQGTSRQAPVGMSAQAVQAAIRVVKNARIVRT